ncbi:MAG: shikimate dehydrogenase [Acidobacteriaceae bacterium]|nr:shikimate dehydrogenase [Acidobacteriaceae bacterium]
MTTPLLCTTITADTTDDLVRQRDAVLDTDLVELRLDTVADPDPAAALAGRRHPAIVTCRAAWEGGSFRGSEDERLRILERALALGAEYVDVEFKADYRRVMDATGGRRVVLSSHEFDRVPDDLHARAAAMRATGAEMVKIAARVNRLTDVLRLRQERANGTIIIGMGPAGLITRVLPGLFGSAWTYAGNLASIGQVTAATLLDLYRFRSLTPRTRIYGLTGSPIAHSVSPDMHNRAYAALGLDAVYLPCPAADADDFLAFAEAVGIGGASVTIPFKVPLFERLDEVSDIAVRAGAINTIKREGTRWIGTNTDVAGFLAPLQARHTHFAGLRASILGAGGSARAAALALSSVGASVTLHARDARRAEVVAQELGARAASFPPAAGSWDLLVNCTPVGMHPNVTATPIEASHLTGAMVYDLIYNPVETRLLQDARAMGADTIGGLDMLVAQAVEQIEWWTGVRPSGDIMRAAALARLSEFRTE